MCGYRLCRLATTLTAALIVSGCSSWFQTTDQVLVREPGHRVYGDPIGVQEEAKNDWQFALLSLAAYSKVESESDEDTQKTINTSQPTVLANEIASCLKSPTQKIKEAGWTYWQDFPDAQLKQDLVRSHLRVEVWQRNDPPTVAVAFGGTVFTSGADWTANLRWFIPHHDDEYTQLVKRVIPAFLVRYDRLEENATTGRPPIYSTGHSLGGGLAQEFAYALPQKAGDPKVVKVFAFDPSPVTGYYSIEPEIRERGKDGLQIDRVFERGEVLASIRSVLALINPPSVRNPTVRAVRYNFEGVTNPVSAHSMPKLACALFAHRPGGPTASEQALKEAAPR